MLNAITLSVVMQNATFYCYSDRHYAQNLYAECRALFIVMVVVIMLNVGVLTNYNGNHYFSVDLLVPVL